MLDRTEIHSQIDSVDIEIHEVQVEGVYVKVEFWPSFQTCYVFVAIATECNFVVNITVYYVWIII